MQKLGVVLGVAVGKLVATPPALALRDLVYPVVNRLVRGIRNLLGGSLLDRSLLIARSRSLFLWCLVSSKKGNDAK